MKEKTFRRLLIIVMVVCITVTVIHFAYDVYAYWHCSIIYFIAKELWPYGA